MAAVFPSLAACQDNAPAGPIEIPDHPLVRETLSDCLTEAMDINGLKALVRRFEERTVRLHFIDTVEPSVLAHEILGGAPYTYLDEDTEIGERRSRAVPLRRGLPVQPHELDRLDPAAIERVRAEAAPDVRDPNELHDVLLSLVAVGPRPEWSGHFEALASVGRSFQIHRPGRDTLWAATERRAEIEALFPEARLIPDHPLPPALIGVLDPSSADPAVTLVRGHLDISGPVTREDLATATGLPPSTITISLETLRAGGFAVSGRFEPERTQAEQWCSRRLLARIHGYTRERRRAAVRPISQEEWQGFLQSWWHATPRTRLQGRAGLAEVIEQLQGFEWPAGEWEQVLAERVESYRPEWIDELCLSGEVTWGRLSVLEPAADSDDPAAAQPRYSIKTPSRRTPISFMLRQDLPWLLQAHRGTVAPAEPSAGSGREVLDALRRHGALFHADLQAATDRLPADVEEGLWDGVARGLISADGFNAVRSLLNPRTRFARRQRPYPRPGLRSRGTWRHGAEGRWTLLPPAEPIDDVEELAEAIAWQLLLRWGVVFRDVYLKERLGVPWREVLWALRRLEARGQLRGGRFVTGVTGEQFAHEEAVPLLRPRRAG
jgi:ATP-dependent helicase Lhr and Lhr-like helicase